MRFICILSIAAGLCTALSAGAEEPVPAPESIPAGKGSVDASGKFVPTEPVAGKAPAESREKLEARLRDSMQVRQEAPGRFRIGSVSFDRQRRVVTIPAAVNMVSGIVEYGLVTESGKVHEAVFTTKANPTEIHLACLLLGVSKSADIQVTVTWDTNGPPAEHGLAEMVATSSNPSDPVDAKPLPAGPWRYTGSVMEPGGFAAAREGSVISLISDPSALVENPRDDSRHDDQHVANSRLLPPKGSPVHINLTLPAASPNKP